MNKCTICTIGSWIVGLATIVFGVIGVFDLAMPAGTIAGAVYTVLVVVAVVFLYYQVRKCPRCAVRQTQ